MSAWRDDPRLQHLFDGVAALGATFARRHVVLFHAPRQDVLVRRAMEAVQRALPHPSSPPTPAIAW